MGMTLTPEMIAVMTPAQIAAFVNAQAASGATPGTPKAAGTDTDDVNIDDATSGGLPPFPEGVFDCTFMGCQRYMSADQGDGQVPMFRAELRIDTIVSELPERPKIEGVDENPPPCPVVPGEIRKFSCKTTTDKNNQPALVRLRDLMQALLRFEPGSKLAETATDGSDAPVVWASILKEALASENPLGGCKVRVSQSRIITKKAKKAMYVPTFSVPPSVTVRTDGKVTGY